ncbi:MAG TPA: VOC family protein [Thermoanaerobaculia bacterium]|nr:VOC family protein [Thermoanaerobaculia bacterium]
MRSERIVGMALCGLLALGGKAVADDGLGVGRGIDHVGMLVRLENFDAAGDVLTRQLGFSATPVLLAPGGVENRLIWFEDLSYLELDAFTESNPGTAPFLAFLEKHEGAKFYGTEVLDAARAVAFLDGAGYPNVGPIPAPPLTIQSTGQVVGLTPLWTEIILTARIAPDNSNFFLDYDEAQVQQLFVDVPALAPRPHPNTAERIDTLWLVVADLDAAIDFYTGLGLEVVARNERIDYLGGRGARVRYHNATLALLQPDGPGLVADFAADRGEGILGVSLAVHDLVAAHRLVEGNTGLTLPTFRDRGRDRFLIPASLTHGVLIEMVE